MTNDEILKMLETIKRGADLDKDRTMEKIVDSLPEEHEFYWRDYSYFDGKSRLCQFLLARIKKDERIKKKGLLPKLHILRKFGRWRNL